MNLPNTPIKLAIDGMRCAGCVSAVETALHGVQGVEDANVSFAEHTAAVQGSASPAQLILAVTKAGYGASEILDEEKADNDREAEALSRYRQLLHKSWFALAVAIPALGVGLPAMLGLGGHPLMQAASPWLALLTLAVMLVSGPQFFVGMWKALRGGHATMDTLIALGMAAAWPVQGLIRHFRPLLEARCRS